MYSAAPSLLGCVSDDSILLIADEIVFLEKRLVRAHEDAKRHWEMIDKSLRNKTP